MKKVGLLILAITLMLSCEHRLLTDPDLGHYVRIYLDEDIPNVTCGFYNPDLERPQYKSPDILRVVLASAQTGRIISQRYLSDKGEDERGTYIEGHIPAPAGVYDILIYSIGSSMTLLDNEDSFHEMKAYTSPVSERLLQYIPSTRTETDQDRIVNQPDHLFHQVYEQMEVRFNTEADTLRNSAGDYFTAHSTVKSYYIQIDIKGLEYVKSAASTLSGMAGSILLHRNDALIASDSVHVFFGMNYTGKRRISEDDSMGATLYSTFNTFGKIDDIPSIFTVNLEFSLSDGTTQTEKIDITDMFDTPQVKQKRWIILEKEIEITPPEGYHGGGLKPGVEGWQDVEADIDM